MSRKLSVSKWKKKVDAVFSRYIRLSHNTKLGCQCYTCGKWNDYKRLQAGHYISRRYNITRFNEMNVKPQCYGCNVMQQGKAIDFREHLVKEYGEKKVKLLEQMRHKTKQFKVYELEEMLKKYKAKLKEVE